MQIILTVPFLKKNCVAKSKVRTCAGKVTTSVLWDSAGVLFVEFLNRSTTVNLQRYVRTLKKLITTSCMITTDRGVQCSPSSALQSPFCSLRLPPFWPPAGRTPKTPFCRRRRAETAWIRAPTLQLGVLRNQHTESYQRCALNEGDFVEIIWTLYRTSPWYL